jgi:RimJ/RimL family protein N-acetyltransferase
MPFAIRDAVRDDAEALVALRLAIFAQTDFLLYGAGEYKATPAEVADQIDKIPGLGHSRALVAVEDGELAGMLNAWGSAIPRIRHAATLALGVRRASWGRGIGAALLAEVIRWAPGAGLKRLELFVAVGNHRAIALYERMGFQFEGTRRHAYVIRGEPVDDWMMAYVFD